MNSALFPSVENLGRFYAGRTGRLVRRIIQARIKNRWKNTATKRIAGCGYAAPYMGGFLEDSERAFILAPHQQGAFTWPGGPNHKNLICINGGTALPIENSSVDHFFMIHDLEFRSNPSSYLQELWRILKPGGRGLIIVPNRNGMWARTEWSPFGHGRPFTQTQILNDLDRNGLTCTWKSEALFMPPVRYTPVLKAAGIFETLGRSIIPMAAGVHIVEVSKDAFAGTHCRVGTAQEKRYPVFTNPVPHGTGRDF